jgi:hypothetical protein
MRIAVQKGVIAFLGADKTFACCSSMRRETLTDEAGLRTVSGHCADRCRCRSALVGGPTLLPCIIDKAQWRVPGT